MNLSALSQGFVDLENQYGARNYAPLQVVLSKGQGARVWDVDGKEYLDFLSAYSAVNQGHSHPKIIAAMVEQASKLSLTSRAFYNERLGEYEKFMCELFGFERMIPMNSGAEAVETAMKFTRRWGHDIKKIPDGHAKIIVAGGNFHGRTISIISASTDPSAQKGFGPLTPGFVVVPYDDLPALETALKDPHVAGFLIEPIQGEAGVLVPKTGYLKGAYDLCKKNHVLFVADEVQTGLARTGKMLACDHDGVKPDVLILGKALSGGMLPISAVLASHEIMLTVKPGEHGSTFGGNPLACAVAMAAVKVLIDEKLAERAERLGKIFREELTAMKSPLIELVRGRGLLNAIVVRPHGKTSTGDQRTAIDVCHDLADIGVLAKQTHVHAIRFAPPLVISEDELQMGLKAIRTVLDRFA
jgi:ornithine--oxo-acid transaminase